MTRRLPGRDDAITCTGRRSLSRGSFVTGRDDGGILNHQNDCTLGRTRAVNDTLGNHETLPRSKIDGTIFEVDDEVSVEYEEELIVVVVFMPVVLALHDP